ncbi:hypothetical protein GCM10022204_24280 [Microlunatus aurantiacus]|uniref:Clp R domain-containing protein n=1 Tax=Microlunatus aurantiacus TaxID=446786 RepID=A0ABP7DHP8_9ACTN
MFEKFTAEAREAVVAAQEEARSTGAHAIDSRHVLLALVAGDRIAARTLDQVGVDPAAFAASLRAELCGLDTESLASIGIDLDAVRERADAVFGAGALDRGQRSPRKGHLPFAADGKQAMEQALREAVRLRSRRIDGRMLLLGLLRPGLPAESALASVLTEAGSDPSTLRQALEAAA